ncbi:MAG: zinc ABC transporter substrate-binding protein [Dysgonamonadaceae bacterium]|nr:zinc ABC transporter substrate-binding protein [Dysgonamonadaceae bacterium]
MTKVIKYFLACCLFAGLSVCRPAHDGRPLVAVTIEPQRYFAEQLVDSLFDIAVMVPAGVSPETYDPSPQQMAILSRSKAYLSIGPVGFNLLWLDKIRSNNPQLPVFDNSENILPLTSGHDPDSAGHATHHHPGGTDPHIWSSPKSARILVQNMYKAFVALDAGHKNRYTNNLLRLQAEIDRTDSILSQLFAAAETKSFIIYHPALSYLARDYGLTQYCIETDGKEPSPAHIRQLIETARRTNIKVIFIQEEFDGKNAEVIARETGCRLIVVNPLSYHWSRELIRIAQAIAHE